MENNINYWGFNNLFRFDSTVKFVWKKNKSTSECKDTERDVSWTKRRADKMRFDGVSKRLSSIFCAILTESD